MRESLNRKLAMFMTFVLIVPFLMNMNIAIASAAVTPSFTQNSVEIVGVGETYQMEIKDQVAKSKYSWSSSNTNIAKVTNKGLVSSIDKGVATIKCKITYPSKHTTTLSCKVTVTIPATDLTINNSILVNGAHVMMLGDTMDFNCDMLPVNSTDAVYWSIGIGDPGCIRIDDAAEGRITAMKAGKVTLVATAAKQATADAAKASYVNDAVIIEVVGPTATVKSVDIIESNKIQAVFDSPVDPSTVIGANGALADSIEVTMSRDTKGVVAADSGKLTASLSTDGKTLTIISEKPFTGYYGINFTSSIMTTGGIALETYYKKMNYSDTTPPAYAGCTTDDTGKIVTINFSEPINFNNMRISGAALVTSSGQTANQTTLNILNNALNYTISTDKKSMTINLSGIASADLGKTFSIIISGITDMAGNIPANVWMQAFLTTDTSNKPQAALLDLQRTGYNTLTATFNRAISNPGIAMIENGASMTGVVDINDNKKVNYTMSTAEALYTGVKKVTIGFWNSYNVDPLDTSTNKMSDRYVNFTVDATSPVLVSYVYDTDTGILTLTYNKDVTLTSPTGSFLSSFASLTDEILTQNISYTQVAHSEGNKVIKLKLTGMALVGTYQFALPQAFVMDSFRNFSVSKAIAISNANGTLSELPAPYSITQNTDNLSMITLRFSNKLDLASATTPSNYKIQGITVVSAALTENTSNSATVVLTIADGTIQQEIQYPLIISGVKGYNNSYTEIVDYKYNITLKENIKPYFVAPAVFDTTAQNNIKLNFSEAIKGTMTVKVTQLVGSTMVEIPSTVTINGSSIIVGLASAPVNHTTLYVNILTNTITDMSGNQLVTLQSPISVYVNY